MLECEFGIYVKTHRPDHQLAKVLLASLRRFAPGVDITVIPDDGFSKKRIWGEKALVLPDPFLRSLDGYYKKLWVFFGPYERFIYLDADMLALRDLSAFVKVVREATEPFFFVCGESKVLDSLVRANGGVRDEIYQHHVGDLRLLREFDGDCDFKEQFPFNSGAFATHRGLMPLEFVRERFEAASEFQKKKGFPGLTRTRQGLFMTDQGFINYLVSKQKIPLTIFRDLWFWGGKSPDCGAETDPDTDLRHLFVHWAGCPRPTFLRRRVPAGQQWIQFYYEYYLNRGSLGEFVRDTSRGIVDDVYGRSRAVAGRTRRLMRRAAKSEPSFRMHC